MSTLRGGAGGWAACGDGDTGWTAVSRFSRLWLAHFLGPCVRGHSLASGSFSASLYISQGLETSFPLQWGNSPHNLAYAEPACSCWASPSALGQQNVTFSIPRPQFLAFRLFLTNKSDPFRTLFSWDRIHTSSHVPMKC